MSKPRVLTSFSESSRRSGIGALAALAVGAMGAFGCPDDPLDEARQLEAEGALPAAGEAYLAAAKADPALLAAWDGAVRIHCRQRGDVGRCLGVLDYELELLGRVERHAAALAEALEMRARARLETGLVDPARSDLERAEQVAPERASVQAALARVALARGDKAEARTRLERARRLDPTLAELESLWDLTRTSTPGSPPGADPSESGLPAFGR
jgi:tetratricopeptide (TPR) repeat protein